MNEVEKLYSLAGVERKEYGYCSWDCDCPYADCEDIHCDGTCPYWEIERVGYPPFTAEKQLELIKLLAEKDNIYITYYPFDNAYNIRYCVSGLYDGSVMGDKEVTNVDFEEALAGIINNIWESLTEEERQQVKGILE